MLEMTIYGDPKKVAESGYDIEEFNETIRKICLDKNFIEIGPNQYRLKEGYNEIGCMLNLRTELNVLKYIFPNLGKWTVYTDEDGEMDGLLYL